MIAEILYFDGCPNYHAARELVERVSGELGLDTEIRMVEVADPEAAQRLRFLGSPTISVEGRDVEPGAENRDEFVLACRVYRLDSGVGGLPAEQWIREALVRGS